MKKLLLLLFFLGSMQNFAMQTEIVTLPKVEVGIITPEYKDYGNKYRITAETEHGSLILLQHYTKLAKKLILARASIKHEKRGGCSILLLKEFGKKELYSSTIGTRVTLDLFLTKFTPDKIPEIHFYKNPRQSNAEMSEEAKKQTTILVQHMIDQIDEFEKTEPFFKNLKNTKKCAKFLDIVVQCQNNN